MRNHSLAETCSLILPDNNVVLTESNIHVGQLSFALP